MTINPHNDRGLPSLSVSGAFLRVLLIPDIFDLALAPAGNNLVDPARTYGHNIGYLLNARSLPGQADDDFLFTGIAGRFAGNVEQPGEMRFYLLVKILRQDIFSYGPLG
ncbi:MAG: hypothetical protein PHV82_09970 [Victivallaceae bacterium]|nr:hypothetical protein [Victivallaceae bacterium]